MGIRDYESLNDFLTDPQTFQQNHPARANEGAREKPNGLPQGGYFLARGHL